MTYVPFESHPGRRWLERKSRGLERRIWRLFRPVKNPSPLFLIGSGRSGTDLVVENLSRSPELDVYNETHPAAFENWRLRDFGALRGLVEKSRARWVLFKPIVETHRAREMLEFDGRTKILFAIRNPADTVNSIIRFFGDQVKDWASEWSQSGPNDSFALNATSYLRDSFLEHYRPDLTVHECAALQWWVRNSLFFELGLSESERVRVTDYDVLTGDPEGAFRGICSFLGISFRKSMAKGVSKKSKGKHPPPELDESIQRACEDLWESLRGVGKG